ncbi:MAG TPA: lactate racemase domain-containing protein [Candidatus Methylomirabilis sp.]|nr:lactate racemase domain-containing protein [Candidatus Methylomirabilis sp.]
MGRWAFCRSRSGFSVKVELPYGKTAITAELPAGTRMLSNTERAALPPVDDLDAAVRAALARPRGLPRLGALVHPGASVTIAFDDHTTGSFGPIREVAIRAVLDELDSAGVRRRDVTLICANALHRMLRPSELARLLGEELVREFGDRLICHDAEDPEQIADLGVTAEHGYPVEVHRLVAESSLTVYVNTNYIRGFTGGWKSVCVGLSTWRTIRVTHTPDGMSMSVNRNRMHAVLDEMGHHLEGRLGRRRVFKIDTLLADPHRVARIFAGAVDETRRAALEAQALLYPPRREASQERVDVLVYGVPDSSPYAIFASVNPILTLISSGLGYLGGMIEAAGKPGCTVIMAAPARDEWDRVAHPSYPEVWERFLSRTRDPYEITERHAEEFARRPDYVEAYRHRYAFHPIHGILATHPLKRLRHVGRVIVAAPQDVHVPRHLGFDVAPSVEEAIASARRIHGPDCAIAHVEQPPLVAPFGPAAG